MIPTMENLEITKRFYDELTAIQVRKTAWRENLHNLKKLQLILETSSIFIEAFCVLSIMPERPVRDQWDYPRKNGGHQFSDQAGPTESNGYHPFLFVSRIPYISEIYWREVEQWTGSLSKRNGTEFRCNRSEISAANWTTSRNGPFYLTSNRNFQNFSRLIYRKFLFTPSMHCEANQRLDVLWNSCN